MSLSNNRSVRHQRVRRALVAFGIAISSGTFAPQLSAQTFEGAITIRMATGAGRGNGSGATAAPQELEYLARAGNVRVSMLSPMGAVSIIGLAAEKKTYIVSDAQKSYSEIATADMATANAAIANTKIERTGRKETVAGMECEHVLVETPTPNGPQRMDVCLTKALGAFVNPLSAVSGGRMPAWQQQLTSENAFPLKVMSGEGNVILEVTKVTKRRVSDATFRIPPEYSRVDMPRKP